MVIEDEEKISFITPDGLYCYTRMPFDLKNIIVDFQDAINRMFQHQLGQNIEAYIDDILAESRTQIDILDDLIETFSTFESHGLKLVKCSFGIHVGKFLGDFDAKEINMKKYLDLVSCYSPIFLIFGLDTFLESITLRLTFSKLHTDTAIDGTWIEPLTQKSIDLLIVSSVNNDLLWMDPIITYIKDGTLQIDSTLAKNIRSSTFQYVPLDNLLYRCHFLWLLFKCMTFDESNHVF